MKEYVKLSTNRAVSATVKADGMEEKIYDTVDGEQGRFYDYQLILTGLTKQGISDNLLNTKITVIMYAKVNGNLVFGDTKSFSYNDVLAVMQKQ